MGPRLVTMSMKMGFRCGQGVQGRVLFDMLDCTGNDLWCVVRACQQLPRSGQQKFWILPSPVDFLK